MAIPSSQTFGEAIRALRRQRGEPLRVVAAGVEVDSTLLSKIERGQRLPTATQIARIAAYFDIPLEELRARVIADRVVFEYGLQEATLQAAQIIRERTSSYMKEEEKS